MSQLKATMINPSFEIIPTIPTSIMPFQDYANHQSKLIEEMGRTCYLSHDKSKPNSDRSFIRGLVKSKHDSVLEHEKLSVRIVCSRAASHQLVRHRLASFSQESQRYVNYTKSGTGDTIRFINDGYDDTMIEYFDQVTEQYFKLIGDGKKAEDARSILPNACATHVAITANMRQWRTILSLRCDKHAQREIRSIALAMLSEFHAYYPHLFEDLFEQHFNAIVPSTIYSITDELHYDVNIIKPTSNVR